MSMARVSNQSETPILCSISEMLPTDEVDKFNLGEDAVNPDKPIAHSASAALVSALVELVSAPAMLVSRSTVLLRASDEAVSATLEELSVSADTVCTLPETVFG